MLFTSKESTEDILIRILRNNKSSAAKIHKLLKQGSSTKKITLQALYRALKRLVSVGVLVKDRMQFTVSNEWARSVIDKLEDDKSLLLEQGEEASYLFRSLSSLDAYWKHMTTQLRNELGGYPIFFYNTHVVWLHLKDRKESQRNYLNSFTDEKNYAGFVVGGETQLDKEFKKDYRSTYLQIELRKINAIKYDSVTVHGDYVITVKLNKKASESIENLYQTSKTGRDLEIGLEAIFTKGSIKIGLNIEKDSQKAVKMQQLLIKNFYIPRKVKEEFKINT
ncbi:MAG: hypothetical protein KBC22_01315 [Candidatus Pacebacteria bacterium]|nr:hypothetical protein [Candidatus Paceibacterota bacterium]